MSEEQMLNNLWAIWATTAAGSMAKDKAFDEVVEFIIEHPRAAGRFVGTNFFKEAMEKAAARAAAAAAAKTASEAAAKAAVQRGASIPVKTLCARIATNFAGAPKGPGPMLAGTIIFTLLTTGADAYEMSSRHKAIPAYKNYVSNFVTRMVLVKQYHPQNRVPSPKEFDEWYEENY